MKLLANVRTPFQAQDMADLILHMHGHDRFQESNADLKGLWKGNSRRSNSDCMAEEDDDEVVINSPMMS